MKFVNDDSFTQHLITIHNGDSVTYSLVDVAGLKTEKIDNITGEACENIDDDDHSQEEDSGVKVLCFFIPNFKM